MYADFVRFLESQDWWWVSWITPLAITQVKSGNLRLSTGARTPPSNVGLS